MKEKGFTLIEVLIVISIIALLASILIVAILSTIEPAKIRATSRRIEIIEDGLARFIQKFPKRTNISEEVSGKGFPRPKELAGTGITVNGKDTPDMTGGEFLRLMLFPSDEELTKLKDYGITSRILSSEEVGEILNEEIEKDSEQEIAANTAFVDTWGFPFYYRFPGMNHSEKGREAKSHKNWRDEYGSNHKSQMNTKPDIWSSGPDNVSQNGSHDTNSNSLEPDALEPGINDPFSELDPEKETINDDITNWFLNER